MINSEINKHPEFYTQTINLQNPKFVTYSDSFGNSITVNEAPVKSLMIREFKASGHHNFNCIEIVDVFVKPEYRKCGLGSNLIKVVAERYQKDVILVLVGVHSKEYPDIDEKDIPELLKKIVPFYEKNQFVSVNNIYGSYSESEPMLYTGNPIGKGIATRLQILPKENKPMTDKEKLLQHLENVDGSFEDIIFSYINKYHSDFSATRLNEMITTISSSLLFEKIKKDNHALYVSKLHAGFLKTYLEGKMYTTREAAEENVGTQIKNAELIIQCCSDILDK